VTIGSQAVGRGCGRGAAGGAFELELGESMQDEEGKAGKGKRVSTQRWEGTMCF
jgi:hypothetical protein